MTCLKWNRKFPVSLNFRKEGQGREADQNFERDISEITVPFDSLLEIPKISDQEIASTKLLYGEIDYGVYSNKFKS